jgi:hypothetical protein
VSHYRQVWLFLVSQQFSLRIPDLQAVPIDYVMIWTQEVGGFDRQFEGFKRTHDMAAVSRDVKRSVYAMTLTGFSETFTLAGRYSSLHQLPSLICSRTFNNVV